MTLPGRSPRVVDLGAQRAQQVARAVALAERVGRMVPPLARLVAWPAGHVPIQMALRRPPATIQADELPPDRGRAARLVYAPLADVAYRPDVFCAGLPAGFAGYQMECAQAWCLSWPQMVGRGRSGGQVAARLDAYWHGRVVYGLSLPRIGRRMRRDHTSVLAGVRRAEAIFAAAFGGQEGALAASLEERRRALAQALGHGMPGGAP